jgi:hypothetical protein
MWEDFSVKLYYQNRPWNEIKHFYFLFVFLNVAKPSANDLQNLNICVFLAIEKYKCIHPSMYVMNYHSKCAISQDGKIEGKIRE